MKWDELSRQMPEYVFKNYVETDVECPECGTYLHKRTDIVLTSYPAKYIYECPKCGFSGYNY